jgi:ABC-type nitrate/sulfonate/bicarbonate transport system substrate-binding protein
MLAGPDLTTHLKETMQQFSQDPRRAFQMSRREFGRRSAYTVGGAAMMLGVPALLAACGEDAGGGEQSGEIIAPRFVSSTSVIPIFVQQAAGPLLYGKEFGLDVPESNYQVVQSHGTAIQTVLSGDADIVAGSVFGSITAASQGVPLRLFSTARNRDDDVLAAQGTVGSLDQIIAGEDIRVSTDSKGGTAYAELQAMINAAGGHTTVGALPDFTVLESSGQRQSALAAGQVDAAIMHVDQFWQVQKERPDVKILARSVDVPPFPLTGYAAMMPWLSTNRATATAIIRSIAACTKAFTESFDEYNKAVEQLIEKPPGESDLRRLWEFAVENKIWDVDGTVSKQGYQTAADLAVSAGVIEKAPPYTDAVDPAPGEAAA